MKYCCETLKGQLTYECEMHGKDCPDIVFGFSNGEFWLMAKNADYTCQFCPWCGTKLETLQDDN